MNPEGGLSNNNDSNVRGTSDDIYRRFLQQHCCLVLSQGQHRPLHSLLCKYSVLSRDVHSFKLFNTFYDLMNDLVMNDNE